MDDLREPPRHELHDFFASTTREIQEDYQRIRRRVLEDPGTAGDKGEEGWKELFEDWLSPNFHVVTKGRIINHRGATSPQVDVLILHPDYPRRLLRKKTYLAAGVLAAFECKLTLKRGHIRETVLKSASLRRLLPTVTGTPYKEMNSPIIYGLLAQSRIWSKRSRTMQHIHRLLFDSDEELVTHPREMLDMVCVADLGTCLALKHPKQEEVFLPGYAPMTYYASYPMPNPLEEPEEILEENTTPVGDMVFWLTHKLGWEFPSLRRMTDYYWRTHIQANTRRGTARFWKWDVFSDDVSQTLQAETPLTTEAYNEWAINVF